MEYPWMIFTKYQGQELIYSTNSVWTTINGVNGRKFISKTDSSKYIFLPAGGNWDYGTLYNKDYGRYWTTITTDTSNAKYIEFHSYNQIYMNSNRHYMGHLITSVAPPKSQW